MRLFGEILYVYIMYLIIQVCYSKFLIPCQKLLRPEAISTDNVVRTSVIIMLIFLLKSRDLTAQILSHLSQRGAKISKRLAQKTLYPRPSTDNLVSAPLF